MCFAKHKRTCAFAKSGLRSKHKETCSVEARPHLYTNKTCGTEANAKKLLVQHSPHKRTSKRSAGYSLAARMNVCPHQQDGERIFLWSTDSRQIAFTCSPNICRKWMKVNAVRLHIYIMCFACVFVFVSCSHTDVDAALCLFAVRQCLPGRR